MVIGPQCLWCVFKCVPKLGSAEAYDDLCASKADSTGLRSGSRVPTCQTGRPPELWHSALRSAPDFEDSLHRMQT